MPRGRLAVDDRHPPVREAVTDMLRSVQRQELYRLKARYFNGVPANQISATSPVPKLTDAQWRALVVHWSDPKNMLCVSCQIFFLHNLFTKDLVILNL